MAHITIEYVILVPLLFAQIIVFPLAANMMASSWTDAQRDVLLQNIADNLASTIQQCYLVANREEILNGTFTQALNIPQLVTSRLYTATGSLSSPSTPNSSRVLTITVTLENDLGTVNANTILGSTTLWVEDSVLNSVFPDPFLKVQKYTNGTVVLSFEES
jgi:hypothetical protein